MCTFNDPLNDVMACDCHDAFHFRINVAIALVIDQSNAVEHIL